MPDEPPAAPEPVVLERGRYAVFQAPDGGWVVARAVDTCPECQAHGCGNQAEPIMVPAMVIKMASMRDAGMVKKLRAMMAGGRATLDGMDEHVHVAGDPPCSGCGWSLEPAGAEGWTDGTETT